MKTSKLLSYALIQSLGVVIYVSLVALFLSNGEKIFGGGPEGLRVPIVMLLLFVLSALITGSLVLARPIHFYLNGLKKEAFTLLVLNILILFLMTLIIFTALVLV